MDFPGAPTELCARACFQMCIHVCVYSKTKPHCDNNFLPEKMLLKPHYSTCE
jgi:hypothetical protein